MKAKIIFSFLIVIVLLIVYCGDKNEKADKPKPPKPKVPDVPKVQKKKVDNKKADEEKKAAIIRQKNYTILTGLDLINSERKPKSATIKVDLKYSKSESTQEGSATFNYNDNGLLVKEEVELKTEINGKEQINTDILNFTYGNNGLLIKKDVKSENNTGRNATEVYEYNYNKEGFLDSEKYDSNSAYENKYLSYTYIKNKTTKHTCSKIGQINSSTSTSKIIFNSKTKKETDKEESIKYEYNKNGLVAKKTIETNDNQNKKGYIIETYTYDDKERLITKSINVTEDDKNISNSNINYTYNDNDELIKEYEESENFGINGKILSKEKTIEYIY